MAENKHQAYDLAQMQSLPLSAKVRMTQQRIKAWYDQYDGNVYVGRSGGKDSDVLGHIVKQMYPEVPQAYVRTGLDLDSVRLHAEQECDTIIKPKKSSVQIITEYGYPVISKEVSQAIYECQRARAIGSPLPKYRIDRLNGTYIDPKTGKKSNYNMEKYKFLLDAPFRISHMCCAISKKNPSKCFEKETGRKAILGTMADESRLRKQKWLKYGCNAFDNKRPTSQPLSFWTDQDIYQYILENNLKIADTYGDIVYLDSDGMQYESNIFDEAMKLTTTKRNRTGCVYCMFGITQEPDRYLKLKEEEPLKYDYVMRGGKFDEQGLWVPDKGLGYKFVIDWLNEHGNLNIKY